LVVLEATGAPFVLVVSRDERRPPGCAIFQAHIIPLARTRIRYTGAPELTDASVEGVLEIRVKVFEGQSEYDADQQASGGGEFVLIVKDSVPDTIPDVGKETHTRWHDHSPSLLSEYVLRV